MLETYDNDSELIQTIFDIPYSLYDKFIDSITEFARRSDFINFCYDEIVFFSMADKYKNECTRYILGKQVMKHNFHKLKSALKGAVAKNHIKGLVGQDTGHVIDRIENIIYQIDDCLEYLK